MKTIIILGVVIGFAGGIVSVSSPASAEQTQFCQMDRNGRVLNGFCYSTMDTCQKNIQGTTGGLSCVAVPKK